MKRYMLVEDEGGWVDIRYIEERPTLKRPLLLGMIQVHDGKVQYISVKPSRRRKGYGSLLLRVAEKHCKCKLPPKDIMPTEEAEGFWRKHGNRC